MTDAPPHHADARKYEGWAGEFARVHGDDHGPIADLREQADRQAPRRGSRTGEPSRGATPIPASWSMRPKSCGTSTIACR